MSKDGGSAFPKQPMIHTPHVGDTVYEQGGMSLRDWFAGMAMSKVFDGTLFENVEVMYRRHAARAYAVADAMIAEREKS